MEGSTWLGRRLNAETVVVTSHQEQVGAEQAYLAAGDGDSQAAGRSCGSLNRAWVAPRPEGR